MTDYEVQILREDARGLSRSTTHEERKMRREDLADRFNEWDILELAALMQALKFKYDPLLTEYLESEEYKIDSLEK